MLFASEMPRSARQTAPGRRRLEPVSRDGRAAEVPKAGQRERLVAAMIELASRHGYVGLSVAQVSSHAGVSSATFYEQFADKEDCLLAAYRAAARRIFAGLDTAVAGEDWRRVARLVLDGLLSALEREPDAGRILFVEALSGGPQVREARERVLAGFEGVAEGFLGGPHAGTTTLDIPVPALMGAVRSIVSRRLRTHSEDRLPGLVDDIIAWLASYAIPAGRDRWSTGRLAQLQPARAQLRSSGASADGGLARLPRGRHSLPAGVIARNRRARIIHATAEATMAKGYENVTVADIVAAAGVARDAFYEHFANKHHAFLEAQHYANQYILDACSEAYFAGGDWPDRVWNALSALLGLIAAYPALAHVRLVEAYTAGPAAVRNTEDMTRSAGIFLQEGYGWRPQAQALPRLCSQAITGALFELIYSHVAGGRAAELPRQLPQLTYLAIAPFVGPEDAVRLLEQKAREL